MEIFLCPQCGANDLKPFGAFAYKCEACGTVLKEDEEEKSAPPKTHYVAPVSDFRYDDEHNLPSRIDGSTMDEPDTRATKTILVALVAISIIGLLIWMFYPSTSRPAETTTIETFDVLPNTGATSVDSFLNSLPSGKEPSYEEKGITVKEVNLLSDGAIISGLSLSTDQQVQLSLVKPKGFTKSGKKIFMGISIAVKDEKGNVLYAANDINISKGAEGEDYLRYKEKCDISFIVSDSFGFHGRGNYVVEYRAWDKKSTKEITGQMPVFVVN